VQVVVDETARAALATLLHRNLTATVSKARKRPNRPAWRPTAAGP